MGWSRRHISQWQLDFRTEPLKAIRDNHAPESAKDHPSNCNTLKLHHVQLELGGISDDREGAHLPQFRVGPPDVLKGR